LGLALVGVAVVVVDIRPWCSAVIHEVAEDVVAELDQIALAVMDAHGCPHGLCATKTGAAVFGENENFQSDPQWRNLVPFDEYFDGDTGQRLSMIPYLLRPNFVVP